jgi:hypothetical protein
MEDDGSRHGGDLDESVGFAVQEVLPTASSKVHAVLMV